MAKRTQYNFGYPPYAPYSACRHWRQAVKVGRQEVTCSSVNGRGELGPTPDFGVYLSTLWQDKLGAIWTLGAYVKSLARTRPYPALVVYWPDMGRIPVDTLSQLVEICLCKMRQGKKIDIGCNGGHGRTGTLLACLIARKEHLAAERAIAEVRQRYCKHAIENNVQQQLVRDYVQGNKLGGEIDETDKE